MGVESKRTLAYGGDLKSGNPDFIPSIPESPLVSNHHWNMTLSDDAMPCFATRII